MADALSAMRSGHTQAAPFFTVLLIALHADAVAVTPALTALLILG